MFGIVSHFFSVYKNSDEKVRKVLIGEGQDFWTHDSSSNYDHFTWHAHIITEVRISS